MKTTSLVVLLAACSAIAFAAEPAKKNGARGQLNQAQQSGRTFDGNPSSRGNSTLNTGDAVRAKPPATSSRTQQQRQQDAINQYRNSGRANPAPQNQRRNAPPPPPPPAQKKK